MIVSGSRRRPVHVLDHELRRALAAPSSSISSLWISPGSSAAVSAALSSFRHAPRESAAERVAVGSRGRSHVPSSTRRALGDLVREPRHERRLADSGSPITSATRPVPRAASSRARVSVAIARRVQGTPPADPMAVGRRVNVASRPTAPIARLTVAGASQRGDREPGCSSPTATGWKDSEARFPACTTFETTKAPRAGLREAAEGLNPRPSAWKATL
jgi:hypothetical protein